jgi:hypothetical protein
MVTGTTAAASASTSGAVSGTATAAAEGTSGVVTGTEREMNE